MFEVEVADCVSTAVVVEQSVEADALDGGDEGACWGEGLESSAGAYADEGESAVVLFYLSGGEVDVGQCVELVHDNVDVVASYACGEDCDALAVVGACDGVELAAGCVVLNGVEVGGYGGDSGWVAYEDDAVGELGWTDVEVEDGTVAVDDEF